MKALSGVSLVLGFFLTLSRAAPLNSTYPMTMMGLCNSENMDKHHLIGQYVPQCDAHGNFLPRQCSGSTGYCWCVNVRTGETIPDTNTPPGTMPVNCDMAMEMEPYCPYGWTHYEHECFIFINSCKTWIEAEHYCMFVGGNLASIHSYEQNHFLQSLTEDGTNSFPLTWIGANDAVYLTAWLWSDGSKCDYENWSRGYQISQLNETERCLQMNYGLHKKWINAPCNKSLPFICGKMM